MTKMKQIDTIQEVRDARIKLSKRFKNDLSKLVSYYKRKQLQRLDIQKKQMLTQIVAEESH